jgi:transposase
MKRSVLAEGDGCRWVGWSPRRTVTIRLLPAPTLDRLKDLGPLPEHITVHLDAGYDSAASRDEPDRRGRTGQIAHQGEKAPIQAGQRWPVERTHAWHDAFNRLQRCYERRIKVIEAFFDLADAIITIRKLTRRAWTTHRWDTRPHKRPWPPPIRASS